MGREARALLRACLEADTSYHTAGSVEVPQLVELVDPGLAVLTLGPGLVADPRLAEMAHPGLAVIILGPGLVANLSMADNRPGGSC